VYGDDGAALTSNAVSNDDGYIKGDTDNLVFPTLTAMLTVNQATPTVAATGGTFAYDGNPHPGGGTAAGVNSENLTPVALTYDTGDGNAPVNAGTYHVTAHFAGDGNYVAGDSAPATITIDPKAITASLTAADKEYDGNATEPNASMSCSFSGVLAGDTANVICTATSGTFNSANVSTANQVTATVTTSGSAAGNYTLGAPGTTINSTSAVATAHITTKAITATLTAANKEYDGNATEPDATMSCSLTGVLPADSTFISCTPSSGTFNSPNVVSANQVTATVTISGTAASNYTLGAAGSTTSSTSATATAHITTKAITAALTAADKEYDGNATEADASMSCSLTGVLVVDSSNVTCTPTSGTFNSPNVATANLVTATVTISGTAASNYTLGVAGTATSSTSATATAHITAKTLTASIIGNPTKTYDGNTNATLAPPNFSISGLVGTESFTVTKTTGSYNNANVALATTVSTSLAAGDFTQGTGTLETNYNLPTTASGPGHIAKADATFMVTPYSVTYNGLPHTAGVSTITGVNGETGAAVGTVDVSNTTHTNAGTYSTDSWSFTGTANYNNQGPTTITDQIDKANAVVVVTPYNVTYDGNPHTATVTSITGVNGETGATVGLVDVSGTTHINAGAYPGDPWTFTGTANYNNSNGTVDDNIDKANAVVVVTPYNVTYDGSPHTAAITSITGVNGETGATVGTVDASNTTHTNAGTYSTDSWSFTGTGNYNNQGPTTITDQIGKANATFTVTPYTVTYDGNSHSATYTTITGVNGETGATVGTVDVSNTTHTNAGTYASDTWSFTGTANYNNQGPTTITDQINKANATFTVSPYTVTYDGNSHSATYTSLTGVNGETGATVGTVDVSNTTHTNAGTYSTDSWSFTGTANYNNQGPTTITDQINKATPTVSVTGGTSPFNFAPHPATGFAYGVGGMGDVLSPAVTFVYVGVVPTSYGPTPTSPTFVGTYQVTASFAGNTNYTTASNTANITITTACSAFNGFLPPIGGSVETGNGGTFTSPLRTFKLKSTIPIKFSATCFGVPLITGTQTLQVFKQSGSTPTFDTPIDASPTDAATTGNQFRLTDSEWHYNLDTKSTPGMSEGIWVLRATLFDGSTYTVWISIKK